MRIRTDIALKIVEHVGETSLCRDVFKPQKMKFGSIAISPYKWTNCSTEYLKLFFSN